MKVTNNISVKLIGRKILSILGQRWVNNAPVVLVGCNKRYGIRYRIIMKKSAQRDANTAHTLAVVRFGHRPPINTQTHRQDRLQYTARQLASTQCNYAHYIIYLLCMAAKGWIRTVNKLCAWRHNMPLPMPLASLNIISCKYENCQRLQFTTEFAKTQTNKKHKK